VRPSYDLSWQKALVNGWIFLKIRFKFKNFFRLENMRLWVKHARQVVRVVSDADPCREYLAGTAQKNCTLAILEEENGNGLSIIVDQ
jgi:hypothetical protein